MKNLRPRHALFALLVVLGVAAAMPTLGVYELRRCTWKHDVKTDKASVKPSPGRARPHGFGVRTGNPAITEALHAALGPRLVARGFTTLVDEAKTRPRIDVALEEAKINWTPFYAATSLKTRALLTPAAGADDKVNALITLEGSCIGLVGREAWQSEFLAALADHAADALGGTAP